MNEPSPPNNLSKVISTDSESLTSKGSKGSSATKDVLNTLRPIKSQSDNYTSRLQKQARTMRRPSPVDAQASNLNTSMNQLLNDSSGNLNTPVTDFIMSPNPSNGGTMQLPYTDTKKRRMSLSPLKNSIQTKKTMLHPQGSGRERLNSISLMSTNSFKNLKTLISLGRQVSVLNQGVQALKGRKSMKKMEIKHKAKDIVVPVSNQISQSESMGAQLKARLFENLEKTGVMKKKKIFKGKSRSKIISTSKLPRPSGDALEESQILENSGIILPNNANNSMAARKVSDNLTSQIEEKRNNFLKRMHTIITDVKQIEMDQLAINEKKAITETFSENVRKKSRFAQFLEDKIIIRTSNSVYQLWKFVMTLVNFVSSFHYAYAVSVLDQISAKEQQSFYSFDAFWEFLFLADMLTKVLVEHHYETSQDIERDIWELLKIYIRSGWFPLDLLTVIPFATILDDYIALQYVKLFYLLKLFRLFKGFYLLNYKAMMRDFKNLQRERLSKLIQTHVDLGENQIRDQTNISLMLRLKYLSQAISLIFILVSLSYLTGMLWWVFCDMESSIFTDEDTTFLQTFSIESRPHEERVIVMAYYMFTSLSTVGLGDYHPTNDVERTIGACILLFGVLLTSFTMENFMRMIRQLRTVDESFESSDQLSLFISTIKKFNENKTLPVQIQDQIERYFTYRWCHHINHAISSQDEKDLLTQLPLNVQQSIYIDYLFRNFLKEYKTQLKFSKDCGEQPILLKRTCAALHIELTDALLTRYKQDQRKICWSSDRFRKLVVAILSHLEPQQFEEYEVIFEQDTEVDDIVFLLNGTLGIGYHMPQPEDEPGKPTGIARTPVYLQSGSLIVGLFEIFFNQKSRFLYRTDKRFENPADNSNSEKTIDCFFIRRKNLFEIMSQPIEMEAVLHGFKTKIMVEYALKVYDPIMQDRKIMEERKKQNVEFREKLANKFGDSFKMSTNHSGDPNKPFSEHVQPLSVSTRVGLSSNGPASKPEEKNPFAMSQRLQAPVSMKRKILIAASSKSKSILEENFSVKQKNKLDPLARQFYKHLGCTEDLDNFSEDKSDASSKGSVTDSETSMTSDILKNQNHLDLINSVEDRLEDYWELVLGFILRFDQLFQRYQTLETMYNHVSMQSQLKDHRISEQLDKIESLKSQLERYQLDEKSFYQSQTREKDYTDHLEPHKAEDDIVNHSNIHLEMFSPDNKEPNSFTDYIIQRQVEQFDSDPARNGQHNLHPPQVNNQSFDRPSMDREELFENDSSEFASPAMTQLSHIQKQKTILEEIEEEQKDDDDDENTLNSMLKDPHQQLNFGTPKASQQFQAKQTLIGSIVSSSFDFSQKQAFHHRSSRDSIEVQGHGIDISKAEIGGTSAERTSLQLRPRLPHLRRLKCKIDKKRERSSSIVSASFGQQELPHPDAKQVDLLEKMNKGPSGMTVHTALSKSSKLFPSNKDIMSFKSSHHDEPHEEHHDEKIEQQVSFKGAQSSENSMDNIIIRPKNHHTQGFGTMSNTRPMKNKRPTQKLVKQESKDIIERLTSNLSSKQSHQSFLSKQSKKQQKDPRSSKSFSPQKTQLNNQVGVASPSNPLMAPASPSGEHFNSSYRASSMYLGKSQSSANSNLKKKKKKNKAKILDERRQEEEKQLQDALFQLHQSQIAAVDLQEENEAEFQKQKSVFKKGYSIITAQITSKMTTTNIGDIPKPRQRHQATTVFNKQQSYISDELSNQFSMGTPNKNQEGVRLESMMIQSSIEEDIAVASPDNAFVENEEEIQEEIIYIPSVDDRLS